MAIEALLERLCVALETGNDLAVKAAEGRERVLAAAEAASSTAPAKAKPAAAKSTEKPAETAAAETEKPAATETQTPSELQTLAASYIGADGISDAEKKARNGKLKEVLAHPKVNATKLTDVPKALEGAVIKALKTLIENGNVIAESAADEDEDADLLG